MEQISAKDKAKAMVDKFSFTTNEFNEHCDFVQAKQCALIACAEILETYLNKDLIYPKEYAYFKEVEQEINNL